MNTALYIAGIPFDTLRGGFTVSQIGGATVQQTTGNRTAGDRQRPAVIAAHGTIYPNPDVQPDSTDVNLRALLKTPGALPLILPDGRRLAVRTTDTHSIAGNYAAQNDVYTAAWQVVPNILLAAMDWGGSVPGQYGYHRYVDLDNPANTLFDAAGWTIVPGIGVQLLGTGAYGGAFLTEHPHDTVARVQPVLEVACTVGVGCQAAVTLAALGAISAGLLAGTPALGVEFTGTAIRVVDDQTGTVVQTLARTNVATRYRVVITARPTAGRVEVWSGTTRLLVANAVPFVPAPWTGATAVLGPWVNVQSGTLTLHKLHLVAS